MATTDRKILTTDDRKLINQALSYYYKGTMRAVTSATEEEIKNHHQAKAHRILALNNRMNTTELDLS